MQRGVQRRKAAQKAEPLKIRIRKNDIVKVITGRDKGKTGRVLDVNRTTGRILVEGVMLVKKNVRPNPAKGIKGGIAERELTLHVSNVMMMTGEGKTTRIGTKLETIGGKVKRTRIARKTGETLEAKKA
jgi:large subunit ribosomal protein L24